ncbi:MAG TPA: chemotaxis protein CheD [Aromatoleum sp.]|uniref:chemotaxis protein CheD n=1 Tax=Aromatoleum sp. TaxID=2307007 RepID=UPI002B45D8CB|nr:chemotaxis protein CheD [Aromatoleum sp.]HJV24368.1 chemotaxis protein CheD [Aromatoleum sp.]
MKTPPGVVEIFLAPGEHYFGDRHTRIRTLLGSCVAISLWHRQRLIGGMCHYLLPSRRRGETGELDGKYADEALRLLIGELTRAGTRLQDYEIKMFGGGNMFPDRQPRPGRSTADHVGRKNVEAGRQLMQQHGLHTSREDLEGVGHRNVVFDLWTGNVWVKHVALPAAPAQCDNCEGNTLCLNG